MADWTFFTNYGHVLFLLALKAQVTVREIALQVGITERAVMRILAELEKDEFIVIGKEGRQNTYEVNLNMHLKHEIEEGCTIRDLISLIKRRRVKKRL